MILRLVWCELPLWIGDTFLIKVSLLRRLLRIVDLTNKSGLLP